MRLNQIKPTLYQIIKCFSGGKHFLIIFILLCLTTACVGTQVKIAVIDTPEIKEAASIKRMIIAPARPQDAGIASEVHNLLASVTIHNKPYYNLVSETELKRSLTTHANKNRSYNVSSDAVKMARQLKSDAVLTIKADKNDISERSYQSTESYCTSYEEKKKGFLKYKSCKKYAQRTVGCKERIAIVTINPKLINAKSGDLLYSKTISGTANDSACGSNAIMNNRQLMTQARRSALSQLKHQISPDERLIDVELMSDSDGLSNSAAKDKFSGALKFAKNKRMNRACMMWNELEPYETKSPALFYNLGVCMEMENQVEQALLYFQRADHLLLEPNKIITSALYRSQSHIGSKNLLAKSRSDLFVKPKELPVAQFKPKPQSSQIKNKPLAIKKASVANNKNMGEKMNEPRTALVIGNSRYAHAYLANPANDARDISSTLQTLGFDVINVTDASYRQMYQRLEEFSQKIKKGGVALVFYAGHGIQLGGDNFLVPIDAEIESETEVRYKTVNLGLVLAKLESSPSRMNIVILDACRNNPFARSFRSSVSGLASVNAPSGTIVAYSTAPGKVAADGEGNNSPYTKQLVKSMRVSGLKIEDVFKQVRREVRQNSAGEQTPWESSSLEGDFYFKR